MGISTRKAYGEALAANALTHPEIVVLDADLCKSTMTIEFKKVAPLRFFDIGIAEQNMAGIAAGLATTGKTVFMSTFAAFAAGRAYEPILNSVCSTNLNVKVCASHAGISVGEDGMSHQMLSDITLMRSIPNMKVFVPADGAETKEIINNCISTKGPAYVRLGRSDTEDLDVVSDGLYSNYLYEPENLKNEKCLTICACGMEVAYSIMAAKRLNEEGIKTRVANISSIKPLNTELLDYVAANSTAILTVEEHNIIGGMGGAVAEYISSTNPVKIYFHGIYDRFGESGKAKDLFKYFKLDSEGIYEKAKEILQ